MSKKPYSAKKEKMIPNQKKIQELAVDDSLPSGNDSFPNKRRQEDQGGEGE